MAELLLEILSEEIPARMQARAAADLKRLVCEELRKERLSFTDGHAFATPRRLTLVVEGVPESQPASVRETKGPAVGAPDNAIQGFLGSVGLTLDQCEKRNIKGKEFWFAVTEEEARPMQEVLHGILYRVIWNFPWPKSMRWGNSDLVWARPILGILTIFDGQAMSSLSIPTLKSGELSGPGSITPSNQTLGHRFLAPEPITVKSFAEYREKLRGAFVVLDREERKRIIAEQANALTEAAGVRLREDPDLLDEVAGLVEWPQVVMGRIDGAYMDLPEEVLVSAMRGHQRYLSCLTERGALADRFLVVANMAAPEGSEIRRNIVAGNERVLRARLADARFFWDQDRLRPLASRAPELARVVFHARLGTLDAKADRMEALAAEVARHVPGAEVDRVGRAARLAKADLVTGMVGEFPELQGVMGRYYARADGEHPEVAEAIAEHYAPLGQGDRCPSAPVSVAVALADKIDTLVGFWAIGETPTGSKDPYALRRAALGVIRLVVENSLRVPLARVIETARGLYGDLDGASVTAPLLDFFADRLKVALRDQGVRHDLISAVFAVGGEDDLVRLLARVRALQDFLATDDGENLLVAYRRAANIVRIEEKNDKRAYAGNPREDRLDAAEEAALYQALARVAEGSDKALGEEDFVAAMAHLAELRAPVDAFFDHVTVNCEDAALRENRLELLARIRRTMDRIADFSKIEG